MPKSPVGGFRGPAGRGLKAIIMLKSYLKIALRKLQKNKLYSFVNITGLTVGIVSCMLIGMYIAHELSYDRFNEKADRIVRVTTEMSGGTNVKKYAVTGTKVGPDSSYG